MSSIATNFHFPDSRMLNFKWPIFQLHSCTEYRHHQAEFRNLIFFMHKRPNDTHASTESYNWIIQIFGEAMNGYFIFVLNTVIFVTLLKIQISNRAPDKLRICVFYAMKTSKNACIIRSECTFTHTYCCVSKLSKFGAYLYAVDDNTSCT